MQLRGKPFVSWSYWFLRRSSKARYCGRGIFASGNRMKNALRGIAKFGRENPGSGFTCSKMAEEALNKENVQC